MGAKEIVGGAMGGVFVPIVIEFGAKGARISDAVPYKWSGVVGTGLGFVTGVLPLVWKDHPVNKMAADTKDAVVAFGGASFATGLSILILDELRKRAIYTFRGEVPLGVPSAEGLEIPPEELIKEI